MDTTIPAYRLRPHPSKVPGTVALGDILIRSVYEASQLPLRDVETGQPASAQRKAAGWAFVHNTGWECEWLEVSAEDWANVRQA